MSTGVSTVYLNVVDAVVNKLREEFINEGVDDSILTKLQRLWESKLMECGAVEGPIERNSAHRGVGVPTPVHDLNVPYEGTEEYETPTADMLFPPTPLETPIQTPLPVEPGSYQYFPAGQNEDGTILDTGPAGELKTASPAPYLQQSSPWMNQRPLGVDVNIAYEEAREEGGGGVLQPQPPMQDLFTLPSGKRKREDYPPLIPPNGYIPQHDGAADAPLSSLQEKVPGTKLSTNEVRPQMLHDRLKFEQRKSADAAIASMIRMKQSTLNIPQNDGFDDIYDNGVRTEDYNTPSNYDPFTGSDVGTPKPAKNEAVEDDEPPLNEDDDDDFDDLEQGDEEPSTNHLVLAQFEKVSRTKSRWKCTLKDGIMHLNNKDILFTKANGEFDF